MSDTSSDGFDPTERLNVPDTDGGRWNGEPQPATSTWAGEGVPAPLAGGYDDGTGYASGPPPYAPTPNSRGGLIAGLVVIVVILAVGLTYFATKSSDSNAPGTTTSSSTSTSAPTTTTTAPTTSTSSTSTSSTSTSTTSTSTTSTSTTTTRPPTTTTTKPPTTTTTAGGGSTTSTAS